MPKMINIYKCDYCDYSDKSFDVCKLHECTEHLHISVDVYDEWHELKEELRLASALKSWSCDDTCNQFDLCADKLEEFEKKYNLENK